MAGTHRSRPMSDAKRILLYLTGHGLGHLAQSAELLIELTRRWPDSRFVIVTSLAEEVTRRRIEPAIAAHRLRILAEPTGADFGMRMHDAVTVDVDASRAAHAQVLANWERHIATLQAQIRAIRPAIVLSNIAFLPIEAAHRLGVPTLAWCSLDWASIHARYCHGQPGDAAVQRRIEAAYGQADRFVQPRPHLASAPPGQRISVAPVGRRGQPRRAELAARLGRDAPRIGLVAMGGMPVPIPYAEWPRDDDLLWLVSGEQPPRADMCDADALGLRFEDLLASVDFVVSKTGYGISVEAALAATPLLYLPRPDWPEEPDLLQWNQRHNRVQVIDQKQLRSGALRAIAETALAMPAPPVPEARGASECAERVVELVSRRETA